ncbi:unnamed protein product [Ambrosiozyma monospora]|uniref:Unnamed protein product n=1 Tax=Ambrosiozyma monospora TaxID=43982 RepID=A0ACB5T1C5_AMBMO|nr:unnamed protein product [Ambrosiozyma monospora]
MPPHRHFWPVNSHKNVGYLCIGTSILVFAIVILGGLTRLTESGLSITEWKPVTGSIPPLSQEDWEEEFAKYKESPEFKLLNSHITLDEFKFIFFMEWSHRLLGRIIGAGFVLPTLYYIARRKVSKATALRLLGICGLIGLQGAIGWWMVWSGIDTKQLEERRSKPTVSQYKLTTHLAAAFVVYCCMISTGFNILRNQAILRTPEKYVKYFQQVQSPTMRLLKRSNLALFGLVFLTALSGGMVAGLDAGLIYNTFPHMGDDWIPSKNELMASVFARKSDGSDLFWRNMFENPTTVQLNHRILAMTSFFAVFAVHMYANRLRYSLPKPIFWACAVNMGLVAGQLSLGIATLLYLVPTSLGAAHQGGALALLTGVLVACNFMKKPTKANLVILKNSLAQAKKQALKNSSVFK